MTSNFSIILCVFICLFSIALACDMDGDFDDHTQTCYRHLNQTCFMKCDYILFNDEENQESIIPSSCNGAHSNLNHTYYMQYAVNLAKNYAGGPWQFSALVVQVSTREIVAQAVNTGISHLPYGHAEMLALINFTTRYPTITTPFSDYVLYTTGESCSMCMSALLYAGFSEIIYGTSIMKLIDYGWPQINIPSYALMEAQVTGRFSDGSFLPGSDSYPCLVRNVLSYETDPLFNPAPWNK